MLSKNPSLTLRVPNGVPAIDNLEEVQVKSRVGVKDFLKARRAELDLEDKDIDRLHDQRFHKVCDNKSHTITVIKVKESNEILGGYNPIILKSDSGRVYENIKDNYDRNHGPSFGFYDLFLVDNFLDNS
ncbi:hypothetical protein C1645_824217 [Glomus cerebriforme]|uniref:TLDc domain-containing protein n=1 Tax=Glomus cerebriforme TaxID=658196 RepID=A0A397SVX3_9GLOM|nr:hypothetical protein C1645_824217 [Glomus cerebriforme]